MKKAIEFSLCIICGIIIIFQIVCLIVNYYNPSWSTMYTIKQVISSIIK